MIEIEDIKYPYNNLPSVKKMNDEKIVNTNVLKHKTIDRLTSQPNQSRNINRTRNISYTRRSKSNLSNQVCITSEHNTTSGFFQPT